MNMEYLHQLADELEGGIDLARTPEDTPCRDLKEGVDVVTGVLYRLHEQRFAGSQPTDVLLRVVRDESNDAVEFFELALTAEAAGDHATADLQFRTGLVLTRGVIDRLRSAAGRR